MTSLSSRSTRVHFSVVVERCDDDTFTVTVNDQRGEEYAQANGPHLDIALRMAVPYMAYVAEPDPFVDLPRGAHP